MARNNTDLDTRLARRPNTGRPQAPAASGSGNLVMVSVDQIREVEGFNSRQELNDLDALAASIQELGLLEPLVVTRVDVPVAGYELVAGHRRLAALHIAGKTEAPCVVFETAEDRLLVHAAENFQRADLTPLEEARLIRRLMEAGTSQRKLSAAIGRSQSVISRRLAMLDLPDDIQRSVEDKTLTLGDAEAFTNVEDAEVRTQAFTALREQPQIGAEHAISSASQTVRMERELAARAAQLKAEGIALLPSEAKTQDGWLTELPADGVWVALSTNLFQTKDGQSYAEAGRAIAEEHSKLPCHAVKLNWALWKAEGEQIEVVPYCGDLRSHLHRCALLRSQFDPEFRQAREAESQALRDREQEEARRAQEIAEQGAGARRAALEARLPKVRRDDDLWLLRNLLRNLLVEMSMVDDDGYAAELLGTDALSTYFASHLSDPAALRRLGVAALAEMSESALTYRGYHHPDGEAILDYFDFLKAGGYTEGPQEEALRNGLADPTGEEGGDDAANPAEQADTREEVSG